MATELIAPRQRGNVKAHELQRPLELNLARKVRAAQDRMGAALRGIGRLGPWMRSGDVLVEAFAEQFAHRGLPDTATTSWSLSAAPWRIGGHRQARGAEPSAAVARRGEPLRHPRSRGGAAHASRNACAQAA